MKRFLKSNKIYFETITTLLLGIMAIIVSIVTFRVSERQYKLSYFESRPEFTMHNEVVKNDSSCYIDGMKLIIKKSDGKAKNISIRVATFLTLTIIHHNFTEEKKRKLIFNYYDMGPAPNYDNGVYYTLSGTNNNRNFVNLWRTIRTTLEDSSYKGKYFHCETRLNEYIEISYLNFENEIFKEYYEIKHGQGFLIDSDKGMQVFYDYDNQLFLGKSIWLEDINRMDVNKLIKELFEMKPFVPAKEDLLFNHEKDKIHKEMMREEYGSSWGSR